MKIFSFALRNVARNGSRTFVTISAMALAGAIMIFFMGLGEGFVYMLERNIVSMSAGDIQMHARGYRDDPDLYKRIRNPDEIIAKLESEGFHASTRLYGFGLAASGNTSSGAMLRGTDLLREKNVTELHRHVMVGKWLDADDPKGVVIGKKLAQALNVEIGSELVIVSQAADGSMANDLYNVRGILKSVSEEIDRGGFLMTDGAFRELMALPEGAHEIAVRRKDRASDLSEATKRAAGIGGELETLNWRQLQPVMAKVLDITWGSFLFMLIIAYFAVGMIILNAMLMSVFERIREFGIIKAIGVSPFQLAALIFTEAMIQAVLAGVLALAVGLPISYYFQKYGLDLSALSPETSIMGVAFDPIWYSQVTFNSVVQPVVFMFIVVAAAVVYPAIKAAVIKPVSAIHYT